MKGMGTGEGPELGQNMRGEHCGIDEPGAKS